MIRYYTKTPFKIQVNKNKPIMLTNVKRIQITNSQSLNQTYDETTNIVRCYTIVQCKTASNQSYHIILVC